MEDNKNEILIISLPQRKLPRKEEGNKKFMS